MRVYGDTAVVTGDWHVAKGERSGQLRITRVWVRGDDRRWRMAAWHGSAVGATAPERRPDALGAA